MKFVTFVWFNSLAIACALIALALTERELNLVCTNTDTQRLSLKNGILIIVNESIDTFGTAITATNPFSIEVKYPPEGATVVTHFDIVTADQNFMLSQSFTNSSLSELKLISEGGQWSGQLTVTEIAPGKRTDTVLKAFYCR